MDLTPQQLINSLEPFSDHKKTYYQWFGRNFMPIDFKLNDGATDNQLALLKSYLLPTDLIGLLKLSNGIDFFTNEFGISLKLYSVNEIIDQRKQLSTVNSSAVLPIMYVQDAGDICLDLTDRVTETDPGQYLIPYAMLRLKTSLMEILNQFLVYNGSDIWYGHIDSAKRAKL